jgi:hypothetical protein
MKKQMIIMANATNSVLQMPVMYQSPHVPAHVQAPSQPPTQDAFLAEPCSDKPPMTDPESIKRVIEQAKVEVCFFTHKSQNGKAHTIWTCAIQPLQKAEELAKINRCRICWQYGHTGTVCIVRPTVQCDHCKMLGHWQPFCGAFISMKIASLKTKPQDASPPPASAALAESFEQYRKRMEAQAAHSSRVIAANSTTPSSYTLKAGAPLKAVAKVLNPKSEETL